MPKKADKKAPAGKRLKKNPNAPPRKHRAPREVPPSEQIRKVYVNEPEKSFRFTPERRQSFLTLIKAGISLRRVCDRLGIDPDTPATWRALGRAALIAAERGETLDALSQEHAAFAAAFDKALTDAEAGLISLVHIGARSDWRAAAWRLACLRPEDYSERWQANKLKVDADNALRDMDLVGKKLANERAELEVRMLRVRTQVAEAAVAGVSEVPGFGLAGLLGDETLSVEVRQAVAQWAIQRGYVAVTRLQWGDEPGKT